MDEDNLNTPEEPEGFGGLTEENPLRKPMTRERIAERAYLISQSDQAGSDEEVYGAENESDYGRCAKVVAGLFGHHRRALDWRRRSRYWNWSRLLRRRLLRWRLLRWRLLRRHFVSYLLPAMMAHRT